MITRMKLSGFRNHADTTIPLQPITLLVGPVGAGKSNVLRALVLLQNSVHFSLVEMFPPGLGEFHWVRSRWAGETDPIGFEIELHDVEGFPGEQALYTLRIADAPEGLYVLEETLQRRMAGQPNWDWVFQRRSRGRPSLGEFGPVEARDPTILNRVWHGALGVIREAPGVIFAHAVAKNLSRVGYYHLEASELKAPGTGQAWDRIGYYGSRLPDFLAWCKSREDGVPVYQAILREMQELLPGLDAIIVTRVGTDQQGLAMAFQKPRGYIAAPDLSDGTLFTLGLLALAHGPRKPAVLCLEEPESGLHPRRLRWVFDRLIQLAYPRGSTPPVQVILTTHSPYLVNLFHDIPESILVVEHSEGRARVRPLVEIRDTIHVDGATDEIGHEWATGLYERL